MLHVQTRYVDLLRPRLLNFKKRNNYLWNCRCPICGDWSDSQRRIATRFYIYERSGVLYTYCHKCGFSKKFSNFLKDYDPLLFNHMVMEEMSYSGRTKAIEQPKAEDFKFD